MLCFDGDVCPNLYCEQIPRRGQRQPALEDYTRSARGRQVTRDDQPQTLGRFQLQTLRQQHRDQGVCVYVCIHVVVPSNMGVHVSTCRRHFAFQVADSPGYGTKRVVSLVRKRTLTSSMIVKVDTS